MVCIITQWNGRLGNNILQIIRSIHYAILNNHNIIIFPKHNLLYQNKINLNILSNENMNIIKDNFFSLKKFNMNDVEPIVMKTYYQKYLKNIVKLNQSNIICDSKDLYIHIRSGDCFDPSVAHSYYVPPPLVYYKKIMENFEKVHIVYEDENNPCVNILKKNPKITTYNISIENSIRHLCKGENLGIGFGTFGLLIYFISTNIKRIYMPKYVYEEMPKGDWGIEIVLVNLPEYTKCGDWKCTQEQLELIVNYHIL